MGITARTLLTGQWALDCEHQVEILKVLTGVRLESEMSHNYIKLGMAGLNSIFDDKFWGKNSNNAVELSQQTPETDIGSRSGQHNPWWGGHASHEVQFQF